MTHHEAVAAEDAELVRAYAACDRLARSHYENFPVASKLLPREMRPHIAAVYAFARAADDAADEGEAPAAERQARLSTLRELLAAAAGTPFAGPCDRGPCGTASCDTPGEEAGATQLTGPADHLIVLALGHSIRTLDLPLSLFEDLLSAFGQDTMTTRYESWDEVLDYCRRSANPIGRLVLRIAGYRDETLDRSSDALCTALQLTNFWQDFGRDWRAGRLYVPRQVYRACGASESELADGHITGAWAQAIHRATDFTESLFDRGRAVCDGVRGRLRLELRFTWLGGRRVLERVDRIRFRLFDHRPTLGPADVPLLMWRAMRWREVRSQP